MLVPAPLAIAHCIFTEIKMALINCRKCGKEYSTRHQTCTQCGLQTDLQTTRLWQIKGGAAMAPLIFVLVVATLIFANLLLSSKQESITVVDLKEKTRPTCTTNSQDCLEWKKLADGCDRNMRLRDAGYTGVLDRNYCTEMELLRERVTGVEDSNAPNAYNF